MDGGRARFQKFSTIDDRARPRRFQLWRSNEFSYGGRTRLSEEDDLMKTRKREALLLLYFNDKARSNIKHQRL